MFGAFKSPASRTFKARQTSAGCPRRLHPILLDERVSERPHTKRGEMTARWRDGARERTLPLLTQRDKADRFEAICPPTLTFFLLGQDRRCESGAAREESERKHAVTWAETKGCEVDASQCRAIKCTNSIECSALLSSERWRDKSTLIQDVSIFTIKFGSSKMDVMLFSDLKFL